MNLPNPAGRPRGCLVALLCLASLFTVALHGQSISEFLAQNNGLLFDEEGESPDWIEIHNSTAQTVNLLDWALTDSSTNLAKWRFPATNLSSGSYLVVFASGKDRRIPGATLHTDFRLDAEGEYLALVAPDGTNVVSSYAPAYPPQLANISYGERQLAGSVPILDALAPARVHVPMNANDSPDWMTPEFDDRSWTSGVNGVGFENSPADYAELIRTDVGSQMTQNSSCYIRIPFVMANPADFAQWRLLVQYDDGFVAYLNGQEIAAANAPDTLAWNSNATANHPDAQAVVPEEFDLTAAQDLIVRGTNVLAIQGLNTSPSSSDFLVLATVEARPLTSGSPVPSYFTMPTPGEPNIGGVDVLGPIISGATHQPAIANATEPVVVTAEVKPAFNPIGSVTLHYRIMFGTEASVPMLDDGAHQDGAAADGVFGATIPAAIAGPGEMIRYYVTALDSAQKPSRLPLFLDARDSAEYFGTVVAGPGILSKLPVVHWFAQNPGQADSQSGARCSVEYLGEFYDNVRFSLHGQSSSGFPKRGYNVDFARDHRFRYATNSPRVKDIKLLTNYADKSRTRNTLAYDFIREAGSVGHFAFPVRVQRNGEFHAILDLMEDADDRWLERAGRDPNGALYKVYNALDSAGGSEKKTRKSEGLEDLQALVNNLAPSRPSETRVTYAYDNLDLPQTISYFVGLALVSSQDHGHKNFYVYRDSERTGEWTIFPWDVDLSWGRNWIDSGGYFTDRLYTNNVLNFYNSAQQNKPSNRLYTLIFTHPDFRLMYLRRLRTVMDTVLQPPETPMGERIIEARIGELLDLMDPPEIAESDADLDYARWGSWGNNNSTRPEAQRIIDIHLPGRRDFLFNNPQATLNGERIPTAQPTNAILTIGALDVNPASGRQDDEFIELINTNDFALDISGWKVAGSVEFVFKPGTVLPAGSHLYLSPNVAAFRARSISPHGGQSLYVQGDYRGQLSARGEELRIADSHDRQLTTTNYPGAPTVAQQSLRLTELMYHPAPPAPGSNFTDEDFEFIELRNISAAPLNLTGFKFTQGVTFDFTGSAVTNLAPGQRVLIVKNPAAMLSRYGPGLNIAGTYSGALDNAGEDVRLQDNVGEVIFEFWYSPIWHPSTDGQGRSLEPISEDALLGTPGNWKASDTVGGSPGDGATSGPFIRAAVAANGQFVITFQAEAGRTYSLYERTSLVTGQWTLLQVIPSPAAGEQSIGLPLEPGPTPHFYRLSR